MNFPHRAARNVALAVGAAAVATTVSVGLGAGPSTAQADPGDTFVLIGSSQLLQSDDITSSLLPFDIEAVALNRDDDFSSCLGEGNPWTSVLPDSPKPISAAWTQRGHRNRLLTEQIAQVSSPAQATRDARTLVRHTIRDCQTASGYDFHYGPTDSYSVGDGYVTVALSYRGKSSKPDGGVAVIRKGQNVGYLQWTGTPGPADQTAESIAKSAVDRLVYSR